MTDRQDETEDQGQLNRRDLVRTAAIGTAVIGAATMGVEEAKAEINYSEKSSPASFKKALNRLGNDEAFRNRTMAEPETLTREFQLSLQELYALRQVAILTGTDMRQINQIRADGIESFARAAIGRRSNFDINISCCCCCCCGETSLVRAHA